MRTLRTIGMALIAVVLSFSFVACSDDDDDEGGNPTVENKINPNDLVGTWALSHVDEIQYDSDGNAKKVKKDFKIDPLEEAEEDIYKFEMTDTPNKFKAFYLYYTEYSGFKGFEESDMGYVTIKDNWFIYDNRDKWGAPEKILKLNSKQLVLFSEADASLKNTESEECTFTKVR